ncbi:ycf20-like protein isoform X2 [Primulina tabacum]|uniref:ycf20-like protein isoform X2 n=1 Tax=Primulina tabacum TaxID=48773 RepID=UPI003F599868
MDVLMLQSLSVIEKERPERSYKFLRHYHGIQDCLYALNFCRQTSKLDIPSYRNRRSLKIAFALNTDGIATDNNQGNLNGDDNVLGGTRLGRIVSAGGRQLLSKLNSARKNFPMKVFLLLLGFYTANALATILGQTGDWDVLVAGFIVAAIEGIGMLMYRRKPLPSERLQAVVVMVNYWKAGVCLGLFVDAFKLGS